MMYINISFSFFGVQFVFIFNLDDVHKVLEFTNKFTDFAMTVAVLHDLKRVVFKNSKG